MDTFICMLEQSWHDFETDDSELWKTDLLGFLTDIRFVQDRYNDPVGVCFTANTKYGPFVIDTAGCFIHDWKTVRALNPELCSDLAESIESLY